MGQDELVLRVPPEHGHSSYRRDPEASHPETSKRSHSRESSGASNLSVKFTVSNDGSQSPRALLKTYDANLKPGASCLRTRVSDRHRLRSPSDSRSDPDEFLCDSDHSNESLNCERLSETDGSKARKSQSNEFNSFCNLHSQFVSTPADASTSPARNHPNVQSDNQSQSHKGHQRNDSEIQMISDASQRRPLLDNHDSSSDDEIVDKFKFSRQRRWMENAHIDMPQDIADSISESNIPAEPLKTLIAFLVMFFGWVVTTVSLALTHERVPDISPLPDILLDNFNYQSWGLDVSEICIMVIVWTAFVLVLFHQHRFVVLRRIFLILGLHYTYRAITMYLTVLPKPNPEYTCEEKLNYTTSAEITGRVLKVLSGMGLSINGKHVYCGDYIYSGHTMTLVTAYLVIKEYSPRSWFLVHWIAMFTSIAGVVMLLVARGHYSIDVLIAYVISTRLWWIYHAMANNESFKGDVPNSQNYLSKVWWWYFFRYFERNVPCNLPLKFGWPIPRRIRHLKFKPPGILRRMSRRPPSQAVVEESLVGSADAKVLP